MEIASTTSYDHLVLAWYSPGERELFLQLLQFGKLNAESESWIHPVNSFLL
jgi:hypothetical protein